MKQESGKSLVIVVRYQPFDNPEITCTLTVVPSLALPIADQSSIAPVGVVEQV